MFKAMALRLQESKNRFSLTLPVKLVKFKGWKRGSELLPVINDKGELVIKEITLLK